jgi:NAD(P)H-hydrate epimerase
MTTLTRAQVRELDRRAIEEYGVPGIVLMENAGRGAAEVLMQLNPDRRPVMIVCGKGNNGGDGFVIARQLDIHGWPVRLVVAAESGRAVGGDAAVMDKITAAAGISRAAEIAGPAIWCVDALFGTGLTGPIREPYEHMVAAINGGSARILAVDIPSGLDCDTGKPLGPCVRADHTVTFVAPKAGFANPESREWTGEVHVVGIGAPRVLLEQFGVKSLSH